MADPTNADVLAAIRAQGAVLADIRATLNFLTSKVLLMANNLDTLTAALDAVNAATSQEAALLAADTATLAQIQATQVSNGPKLDAIQALITDLVNTAGIPQSVLDKAAAAQTAVAGLVASSTSNATALGAVASNTTAQSARLDQLATDPRNPVPTPPPTA